MKTNTSLMEPVEHKNSGRIWTGLFLVAAGFLLLAFKMGAPVPAWLMTWPAGLIALGILISIRHKFRSAAGFILILIGAINLADQLMPDFNFRNYSLPVIIIAIGLFFIFRPKRTGRYRRQFSNMKREEWQPALESGPFTGNLDSSEYLDATCFLGGTRKIVVSKDFKGGDITCFMGGAEIDLTQADIQSEVILDITMVFGGCKLIVPGNWEVKSEVSVVFGGIDDKRSVNAANLTTGKVLILQGTTVFGGIDIRSY